jgi:hypothetical protein
LCLYLAAIFAVSWKIDISSGMEAAGDRGMRCRKKPHRRHRVQPIYRFCGAAFGQTWVWPPNRFDSNSFV